MENKQNFVFESNRLIACVDFLKWTSTLGDAGIRAIETPMRGVQISPAHTDLFGFARDDLGLMLAMDAREAPWLEHLPIAAALHGYDDRSSLLLMTEGLTVMDTLIPQIAIEIHVPLARCGDLARETLLGFCLVRQGKPVRVGRIVPLHIPETWQQRRASMANRPSSASRFFAGA
ncbi:hypothetical protein FAZ69_08320 [Trinickia terrae]|uniref:Uncharacterized protein n=1 Tax=Trinickia terrae TaxID=2571161 RepID=A0A4U1I9G9_9BURK|nr:hypothetical protein [Trinickia terrae]TKC90144.1 hypothetical protein FAZ69_08320 [Trinickia terrae]